jgi:VWFA-related protein
MSRYKGVKMKLRSLTVSLFCLFFLSLTIFAQQPSPTPPVDDDDTLKISTTLIQADVTVTDKKGNPVTDLKPEEFEIYENGKKQAITNFSFISVAKPIVNSNSPTSKPNKNSIPLPPLKLKAEQVRRTYALVVDDLGLSFDSIREVELSLKKFINEQMQDGDLVAIIRTAGGIGAAQSFTSDKRLLLAAVGKLKWNPYGRSGISAFEPLQTTLKEDLNGTVGSDRTVRNAQGNDEDKEFLKDLEQFRVDNLSVGTFGALSYIIRGMRDLPGRKAVMFFSDGFNLELGSPLWQTFRILADLANRSSVIIYTIDPRGLQNPMAATAQDNIRDIFSSGGGLVGRSEEFGVTQQSLVYLAAQTGGTAYINQNFADIGIKDVLNDQSSYYLLGYEPDDETFDPKKNKFNKLEIKVTRPGVRVRYRSGFFAVSDEKIMNVAKTPRQKLTAALISPFGAGEVKLNLYPIFQNDAEKGDLIQALVYIDAKDLEFKQAANGQRKANFDLMAVTFGDNGIIIDELAKNFALQVSERVYQNMLVNGFVYALTVPIKKTGAY